MAMRKHRIVKDSYGYRVQRRICGMWFYYWDFFSNEDYIGHKRFDTIEAANAFVDDIRKRANLNPLVVKTYPRESKPNR
jgi:hypothetical protein